MASLAQARRAKTMFIKKFLLARNAPYPSYHMAVGIDGDAAQGYALAIRVHRPLAQEHRLPQTYYGVPVVVSVVGKIEKGEA